MTKRALITGITGQDGSYLTEYLLGLGYEVHGIVRRHSVAENQSSRLQHVNDQIVRHYGDLTDEYSLSNVVRAVQPDEIYNLAAMSHVRISFDMPSFTIKTNSLGVLNMLECLRQEVPHARFYQASSSEMFGNSIDSDNMQRLTTPMTPVSPYGCSKVMGFNLTRHYRDAYRLHATNGILFNHESPRRGTNFVTNKVVKTAVDIKHGRADRLELGNLDSYRDWGHSADYVRAMHAIVNHDVPRDWVVATGTTHSVRDLCQYVFNALGMNYEDYVVQNEKFIRPEELKYLCGDSSDIRTMLGWQPNYTFESMLDEMIDHWQHVQD
jgi:GDPmannose 4,6-dehydratase